MDTKDMPTEYGSPIYRGHRPSSDSAAVAILRAAGALIFGKTTTTEFTVTNSGPETTNPCDPNRTPGGSSCGSAAAVADMQVPLSLGAQTGGSVIRPASYTGVFAMKPTFNAISVEGQKAFAPSFDTIGFFARSIEDLQLLADVFAIQDDQPPKTSPPEQISIALVKTPMWSSAGPGTISAMKEAAISLQASGMKVEEASLPLKAINVDGLMRMLKVISLGEAQASFLREYRVDRMNLALEIREIVENTSNITSRERMEASDTFSNLRHAANDMASAYTAIITPSAMDEAPVGLGDMGSPIFNTIWTGFHMPVISIPAFVGPHGMPVGISLVGARYRDQQLLKTGGSLAKILQQP